MRGKNKCIILKGGFVEVELDAATRLGSPWTSREGLLGTWLGVEVVDCPTQLICTWIFICCVP